MIRTLQDKGVKFLIEAEVDGATYDQISDDCVVDRGDRFNITTSISSLTASFKSGSQALIGGNAFWLTEDEGVTLPANSTVYLCARINPEMESGQTGSFECLTQSQIQKGNINNGEIRDFLLYIITTTQNGVSKVEDKRVFGGDWRTDLVNTIENILKELTTNTTIDGKTIKRGENGLYVETSAFPVDLTVKSGSVNGTGQDSNYTGSFSSGKVRGGVKAELYTDAEGGNVRIISPNGTVWELDAYNGNLRLVNSGSGVSGNVIPFTIDLNTGLITVKNRITGVSTPTANTDAANKKYVDDADSEINTALNSVKTDVSSLNTKDGQNVKTSGNQTIAGTKTFSTIPVLPSSNPTSDNQAVRKKYVDDAISSASSGGKIITGTLSAGATSIKISDSSITTNSALSFYTSIYGVSANSVTVASGSVTLTFDAQTSAMTVGVRVDGTY